MFPTIIFSSSLHGFACRGFHLTTRIKKCWGQRRITIICAYWSATVGFQNRFYWLELFNFRRINSLLGRRKPSFKRGNNRLCTAGSDGRWKTEVGGTHCHVAYQSKRSSGRLCINTGLFLETLATYSLFLLSSVNEFFYSQPDSRVLVY